MNLKIRLITSYTFFAVVITMIISTVFGKSLQQKRDAELFRFAGNLSNQSVNNFEVMENSMEQAAHMLLSDEEVVQAIRNLSSQMEDGDRNAREIEENKAAVRKKINTAYNIDHYYRIVVYNRYGFIAASANAGERLVDQETDPAGFAWTGRTTGTKGRYVLLGIHEDPWGKKEKPESVFSTVKELQGDHLGFIEIQMTKTQVEALFSPAGNTGEILLKDGEVLYVSEGFNARLYQEYFGQEDEIGKKKNPVTGEEELIVVKHSPDLGIQLISVRNRDGESQKDTGLYFLTVCMGGIFFLCSLAFIIISSHLLTEPLRRLRIQMEKTELSSIYEPFEVKSSDTDIQALADSYRNLMKRLELSIDKEKKMIMVHMQTQFDILQAQVNPHFLFNVLNVISRRGMKNDDEVICDICGNLAAMLRYSTNTKERYATLRKEIDYLKSYVYLLESRYEKRLQVEISIEETLMEECVPKIFIQQMVENSLEHGYCKNSGKMYIEVCGMRTDTGWLVSVEDRGKGIDARMREELMERLEQMHLKLKNHMELLEAEIGGMGLVSAYGRMYLLYGENTVFEIRNLEQERGTVVHIGVDRGN